LKAEYHKSSPSGLFLDLEYLLAAVEKSSCFKMPQSELSHVVKSELRSGHVISDPRPIHRPLNVLLGYSRIVERNVLVHRLGA
jgi:hypothetical protein